MKIVITGSLGHVGQPLAQTLVGQGHAVTVISSKADKQAAIEALGASAAIGSVQDAGFLATAFARAEAVYCMIPPNFTAPDSRAYYRTVRGQLRPSHRAGRRAAGGAPEQLGADLDHGTGFILGSHDVENQLNALADDVAVTHLRAGYIYYNLYNYVGMIKGQGIIGSNYGGKAGIVDGGPRRLLPPLPPRN
ncbi:MAG: NAD(P)H-binding protein [Hymenobacter sp.]